MYVDDFDDELWDDPGQGDAEPSTLLIAGHNAANRTVLANIFSSRFKIEQAAGAREALASVLAAPSRIAAILLGEQMRDVEGVEVLEKLSKLGLTERIPCFYVLSTSNPAATSRAMRLGAMDIVQIPAIPSVILRRVLSVTELFALRRRTSPQAPLDPCDLLVAASQLIEFDRPMLESLATAIEFRDGEAGNHVRNIERIVRTLLEETPMGDGLGEEEVERICEASIVHDLGKIAIPDSILGKPGRFTDDERRIMQEHTEVGARLIAQIPRLDLEGMAEVARDIALHHHERWDGGGYPEGKGEGEVSVAAQVVGIADVYDALRSPRCYKAAYSRRRALSMILEGECGAFNPELLEAFQQVEPSLNELYEA